MNKVPENTSGLEPLGRAVLVRHDDVKEKMSGSIIIPPKAKERDDMVDQRVTVVMVGGGCWPDEPPRAQPGDRVLISAMAGMLVKGETGGSTFRLVNDRDIFAKIIGEQE